MIQLFLIILVIIVMHWISDFVIQTDKQAKGKSNNWKDLLSHTFNYSAVWLALSILLILVEVLPLPFILFAPITFVAHTITDYFTSRINSRLWAEGRVHDFFVAVGFDQVLHYTQLFATFFFLLTW